MGAVGSWGIPGISASAWDSQGSSALGTFLPRFPASSPIPGQGRFIGISCVPSYRGKTAPPWPILEETKEFLCLPGCSELNRPFLCGAGFDSQGFFRSWRGVAHPRGAGETSTLKSLLFVASLSNPRRKWAGKAPGIVPGERTLRAHKPPRAAPPPLAGVSSLLRGAIPGLLGFNSPDNSLLTKLGSHPGISRALQEGRGNERQGCAQGLGLFQQTAPGAGRGSLEMLPALCWLLQRSGIAPPNPKLHILGHFHSFSGGSWAKPHVVALGGIPRVPS